MTETETSYLVAVGRRFCQNTLGVVGLSVLILFTVLAVLAPVVAPYDPNLPNMDEGGGIRRWRAPSSRHFLGTDSIGRDVLSRVIFGARVSLSAGVIAALVATFIGVIVGSLAGYFGGWVDAVLMRLIDVILAFPVTFLLIFISVMVRPSIVNVFVIIGLVFWTRMARIVRGEFLKLREKEFVLAASAVGVRPVRMIVRHLLPNAVSPIIVGATLRVAYAILLEATLSFLGIGVQEPTASWGRMLNHATRISVLQERPWLWIPPGLSILLTVLAINFMGDALRDALDPRLIRQA